jgi:SAM-dependent methyltransferase
MVHGALASAGPRGELCYNPLPLQGYRAEQKAPYVDVSLTKRHEVERAFHDRGDGRALDGMYRLGVLDAADCYAHALVGDVRGQVVLELGCGSGENTVRLAAAGAQVHATDISAGQVELAWRRANAAGCEHAVIPQQMSAEQISYADATFDLVFGHSVIHHTDLAVTRAEVRRVLRPGGRAIFLEPLGHNPLITAFRRATPGQRTSTERPLLLEDLRFFAEPFASIHHREFALTALAALALAPLRSRTLFQAAHTPLTRLDDALLTRWPVLGRFAWVTVIELTR